MNNADDIAPVVNAVETSLCIIRAIDVLDNPRLTDIASHVEAPKSTVFNHLNTLKKNEYIVKGDDESFRLGLRFLQHGIRSRDNLAVYSASSPAMEHLASETELAIWLGVEEYGRVVTIKRCLGERAVPTRGEIGARLRMHSSSLGKAILANFSPEYLEEIVTELEMPSRTANTVTDSEALLEELEQIRKEGVAFNDEESMNGLRAVSAPIFFEGDVCGAICVAGTKSRINDEYFVESLPSRVKDAANEIELNLTYNS